MEIRNTKCSSSKHAEVDAISFCPDCNKYFCNKCLKYHDDIENHKAIKKQDVVEYAKKFFVTDKLVLGIEGNKRKLEKRIDIIKSIISELN